MTPDRWQQIEGLYHSALEREESRDYVKGLLGALVFDRRQLEGSVWQEVVAFLEWSRESWGLRLWC